MLNYEYKVVPAPNRGKRARGVKGTDGRFAYAIETVMNELAGDGWEYWRSDTLPCEERTGLTSSHTAYKSIMIFRRSLKAESPAETEPDALTDDSIAALLAAPPVEKRMPDMPDLREMDAAEALMADDQATAGTFIAPKSPPPVADPVTVQDAGENGRRADDQKTQIGTAAQDDAPPTEDHVRDAGHLLLTEPVSVPDESPPNRSEKAKAIVAPEPEPEAEPFVIQPKPDFVPDEDEAKVEAFPSALPAALLARARLVAKEKRRDGPDMAAE